MTITSVSNTTPTSSIAQIGPPPQQPAPDDTAITTGEDTTQLSGPAQFFNKLQSLEQTDPNKAKQALSDIASKLSDQATKVGGERGKQLSTLADKFSQAAQTGDISGLQPSGAAQGAQGGGHHGGHHGHHHATQSYSQAQNADGSDSTDPAQMMMDTLDAAT